MLDLILDDRPSSNYELHMPNRPIIPTPEQEVERIQIPGRDGDLVRKDRYKDIEIDIDLNLLEYENIKERIRIIKAWILDAKTLRFSDDYIYYKIKHAVISDIENEIEEFGSFQVSFVLAPFQYKVDKKILHEANKIYNNGTYFSEPYLIVCGEGDVSINVNNKIFYLKGLVDYIEIDSELLEAFRGTETMNNRMIGEFPIFKIGENSISWEGNVTRIEITPRWRYR